MDEAKLKAKIFARRASGKRTVKCRFHKRLHSGNIPSADLRKLTAITWKKYGKAIVAFTTLKSAEKPRTFGMILLDGTEISLPWEETATLLEVGDPVQAVAILLDEKTRTSVELLKAVRSENVEVAGRGESVVLRALGREYTYAGEYPEVYDAYREEVARLFWRLPKIVYISRIVWACREWAVLQNWPPSYEVAFRDRRMILGIKIPERLTSEEIGALVRKVMDSGGAGRLRNQDVLATAAGEVVKARVGRSGGTLGLKRLMTRRSGVQITPG